MVFDDFEVFLVMMCVVKRRRNRVDWKGWKAHVGAWRASGCRQERRIGADREVRRKAKELEDWWEDGLLRIGDVNSTEDRRCRLV